MGSKDESIEQAVASRRERLLALRAAQELSGAPEPEPESEPEPQPQPQPQPEPTDNEDQDQQESWSMKFRNYVPHDKHLQEGKLAPAVLPKFEDPVAAAPPPEAEAKEDPFLNIAPKKPNWDLRRDVQTKLYILDKLTQNALYKIMKEQEEQEKQKLLAEGDDTNGTED